MNENQKDILFAVVTGVTAMAAILAMPVLVASPKLLFGRSLTAIAPSLFPYVTLSLIIGLSVLLIIVSLVSAKLRQPQQTASETGSVTADNIENDWYKKGAFFILLVAYGLLLKPFGFLISSCMAITATSMLLGNRNGLQIALLSVLAPICLYLIATRAMLVSLPELNAIELFYAHTIEWVKGLVAS